MFVHVHLYIVGDCIPFRFFLCPYNLTPTMEQIHNAFSVHYYFTIALYDETNRRYYKQTPIKLYRKNIQYMNKAKAKQFIQENKIK